MINMDRHPHGCALSEDSGKNDNTIIVVRVKVLGLGTVILILHHYHEPTKVQKYFCTTTPAKCTTKIKMMNMGIGRAIFTFHKVWIGGS